MELLQKKGVSDNFYFKCRIYFHFMIIRYFSNVLCTFYIYFLYTLSFVKQMIVAEYSVCWLAVDVISFCTCHGPKSFSEGYDALGITFYIAIEGNHVTTSIQ